MRFLRPLIVRFLLELSYQSCRFNQFDDRTGAAPQAPAAPEQDEAPQAPADSQGGTTDGVPMRELPFR